jgi:hypothetical protein
MLNLTSTSDKLQVVTSAAGTVGIHASWVDLAGSTVSAGRTNTNVSTATTTDAVPAPAASTVRNVRNLKVSNNHASISNIVTLQHTDGATVVPLESVTLAPGERLSIVEGYIKVFDAFGREKVPGLGLPTGNANTADIVANAADTYLLGLAIGGRVQAGSFFKYRLRATKTAAGTVAPIFSIRTGTAGAVTDTARTTLTGAAQTAVTDTADIEVDVWFTAVGASAVVRAEANMIHTAAAGAGMGTIASVFNTAAAFDVTPAATILGLSINPGTAGVWTFQKVIVDAGNLIS